VCSLCSKAVGPAGSAVPRHSGVPVRHGPLFQESEVVEGGGTVTAPTPGQHSAQSLAHRQSHPGRLSG
jgi:hypothetical protein